jgi:hypothetical protein
LNVPMFPMPLLRRPALPNRWRRPPGANTRG